MTFSTRSIDWNALSRNKSVLFVLSLLLFVATWGIVSHVFNLADQISSPDAVGAALYFLLLSGDWIPHVTATLRRIFLAFFATVFLGIIFGVLTAVSDFWEEALRPYIVIGLMLPAIFATVFAAMAFGISDLSPITATILIVTPFIAESVQSGVSNIDRDLIEMAGSFGIGRRRFYRRILIPSILPEIFSGVRFAFSVAWKITVLTEVVMSEVGIGFMLNYHLRFLNLVGVLKYVALFVIIMMMFEYILFRPVESYVFDWREDVSSMATGSAVQ